MDFFSHVFWTWAVFKTIEKKIKKPLNLKLAIFWGVFPDLFAFTVPIALIIFNIFTGQSNLSDFPRPEAIEPARRDGIPAFHLLSVLYAMSHSLVIFSIVIIAISIFFRVIYSLKNTAIQKPFRFPWEMAGWMIHILIDIPTHSTQFYSTPFLWPVSDIKFNGLSWGTPWFLALNYTIMATLYIAYLIRKKSKV
jgi:hypothetical protein